MNALDQTQPTVKHWLGDAAMVGVVALALIRCFVAFRSVAGLDFSPAGEVPVTEVGLMGTAVFDALGVGMLLLAVIDRLLRGVSVYAGLIALWLVGLVVAVIHLLGGTGDPAIAGNWIGALALGLAALHLADVPRRRRFMAVAFAAGLTSLALYAFTQFFIQHPRDVRFYELHKDTFLQQRGWEPGSIQQAKWETRLYQREATGRFGLSNVFGTVVAMLTILAAGLVWAARGNAKPQAAWKVVLGIVALLGVVALGLTFSKGAAVALVFTLIAVVLAALISRTWWRWTIAFGAVALVIGVVIVRGLLGPPDTAEGERSLLFRAFYWQAGVTMLADHPLIGVGPGEFQHAYMVDKNPLSPEDVADPHNVFVNAIASLGVGGLAWSLALLVMLGMAARVGGGSNAPPSRNWTMPAAVAAAVLLFGCQFVIQIYEMALIEVSLVLMLGLIAFLGLTVSIDRIDFNERRLQIALLGAALLALVHSQIDMALNNTMSAPLLCAILGLAAARPAKPGRPTLSWIAAGLMPVSLLVVLAVPVYQTIMREFCIDAAKSQLQSGDPGKAAFWVNSDEHVYLQNGPAVRIEIWALHQAGFDDEVVERAERFADSATINRAAAELLARAGRADDALAAACRLLAAAPYNISYHLFAADLAWDLGHRAQAVAWYRRTLNLNDQAYLDPDAQLPADQLDRMRDRLPSIIPRRSEGSP